MCVCACGGMSLLCNRSEAEKRVHRDARERVCVCVREREKGREEQKKGTAKRKAAS